MVAVLELVVYAVLALSLWIVYHQIAEGGRNGPLALVVIVASVGIAVVILSGMDWAWVMANWQDLALNGLLALAAGSLIFGYGRLIRIARNRARDQEDR